MSFSRVWRYNLGSVQERDGHGEEERMDRSQRRGDAKATREEPQLELFRSGDALRLPLDRSPASPQQRTEPKTVDEVVAFTLDHLNQMTERTGVARFRSATSVKERLREGATWRDLALVIDFCHAMWWGDARMEPYIRPKTLFGKENFPDYLVRARKWNAAGRPALSDAPCFDHQRNADLDIYRAHVKGGSE